MYTTDIPAYSLFHQLYETNERFREIIDTNMKNGKIRFFGDEEWSKIEAQNFMAPIEGIRGFEEMFLKGYNIGNCGGMSRQLSFSYDDVSIVSGTIPLLKGTLGAEKEGGHMWLERDGVIIDTTLMLVIDISLKDELGYVEEERLTPEKLLAMPRYQARKEFTNDHSIRRHR